MFTQADFLNILNQQKKKVDFLNCWIISNNFAGILLSEQKSNLDTYTYIANVLTSLEAGMLSYLHG